MLLLVIAALGLAIFGALAACGSGTTPPPRQGGNSDPHHGWVGVGDETDWRCIGPDKVIRVFGTDSSIAAVGNSADC